jgi:hypothetical protein
MRLLSAPRSRSVMLGLNLFKCYHFYYSAGFVNLVVPIFCFSSMAFATTFFEVCMRTFYGCGVKWLFLTCSYMFDDSNHNPVDLIPITGRA